MIARYNQRNRQMKSRSETVPRLGSLPSFRLNAFLLVIVFLPSLSLASNLGDTARQLADRIAAAAGPGSVALEITNRSSLDEKSVREVRSALQTQLRVQGVRTVVEEQSMGTVNVVLSESLREYVWTAAVAIGSDQPRVVLVSLPRPPSTATYASTLSITLKKTFLFSREEPILDAALIGVGPSGEPTGGSARLVLLGPTQVTVYHQQSGRWEPEVSLAITRSRTLPRDLRGRILLRRDHLFDVYLPGTFCRSSASMPLALNCSASDDPWPLTPDENAVNGVALVRAFYAPARNFFTGALSGGIGKISNAPSFYSAAALPRSGYTLWVVAAVDGSIHMIDGITDQAIRGPHWGSDLAAVHSSCGVGTQLLVTDSGDSERDSVRAFEIPDREPIAVSSPLELDGRIVALWPNASQNNAVAIVKKEDEHAGTGLYETNLISITCAN